MTAAERLFVAHGLAAVSNRQIGEAAGQANNSAVGYHFADRTQLVLAIVRRHEAAMEPRRASMQAELGPTSGVADWLACMVLPFTEHLAAAGPSSSYARFMAQVSADPTYRLPVLAELEAAPTLRLVGDQLRRILPMLPERVVTDRGDMTRFLVVQMCSEREAVGVDADGWAEVAAGLVDALVGVWLAAVTTTGTS